MGTIKEELTLFTARPLINKGKRLFNKNEVKYVDNDDVVKAYFSLLFCYGTGFKDLEAAWGAMSPPPPTGYDESMKAVHDKMCSCWKKLSEDVQKEAMQGTNFVDNTEENEQIQAKLKLSTICILKKRFLKIWQQRYGYLYQQLIQLEGDESDFAVWQSTKNDGMYRVPILGSGHTVADVVDRLLRLAKALNPDVKDVNLLLHNGDYSSDNKDKELKNLDIGKLKQAYSLTDLAVGLFSHVDTSPIFSLLVNGDYMPKVNLTLHQKVKEIIREDARILKAVFEEGNSLVAQYNDLIGKKASHAQS